jgi:hypothetical protein
MDASLVQTAHLRISGLASMRSSRREKPAAPAAAPHDIDFRHLWRQLRAAGWKSKRPTGIQTEWTYKSPEGENVLVGERAVVEHAFQSGLLVEDEEEGGGHVEHGGGDGVEHGGGVEHDGGGSVEHRGGGGGGVEHDGGGDGVEQDVNEQRDAAAGLRLLSDASGLESEGKDERAVTSPIAPPRRQRIPLKIDADVNVLQDGESSSAYEDFSSDESDSAGICDDDGDSGNDEIDEEGGDEISDSDAAEMDEAFLASLHIGGNAELSKAALKQRAAALRTMQWTPFMTEFETDTSAYPGLGADGARPVGELLDVRRSSLLTLFFFVPKTVWVLIAKETNRYFLKQVGKRAERMAARQNGRQRGTAAQIVRLLKAPEGYGVHEILRVIGLLVARMLCGALLRIGPWSRTAPFQLDSSGGTCRTIAAKTSCVTYTSLPTPPITAAINCGSCVL